MRSKLSMLLVLVLVMALFSTVSFAKEAEAEDDSTQRSTNALDVSGCYAFCNSQNVDKDRCAGFCGKKTVSNCMSRCTAANMSDCVQLCPARGEMMQGKEGKKDRMMEQKDDDSKTMKSKQAVHVQRILDFLAKEEQTPKVTAATEKVQAALVVIKNDSASKDEVKAALKEIRETWVSVKQAIETKKRAKAINQLSNAAEKYDGVGKRFEERVAKLEEKGIDVTKIKEMLVFYKEDVASAKQAFEDARTAESKEQRQHLKVSLDALKEARSKAKEISSAFKELAEVK
ncbi:hypothetical protein HZB01_05220 [Candidatus Woesearchaeota archaeon]|nr:hypothetical protein [Candidatus Woesearchaeota archaeon]